MSERPVIRRPVIRCPSGAVFVHPHAISQMLTERYAPWREDPTRSILLHADMWNYSPVGRRVFVALDPNPEMVGGVHLAQTHEQLGVGVIVAVGPSAGIDAGPYPGCPEVSSPAQLLYQPCMFGAHVGKSLRLDFVRDKLYDSNIVVMTDRDFWAINWEGAWEGGPVAP